jgi:hypothetical protein
MKPLAEELKRLYHGVTMNIKGIDRQVSAVLGLFQGDNPAVCKCLDFAGLTGTTGCSKCRLKNYKGNFTYPITADLVKSRAYHMRYGREYKRMQDDSKTSDTKKTEFLRDYGVRYSVLLELCEYLDLSEVHSIDTMHAFLLGLCKNHVVSLFEAGFISRADFKRMQKDFDRMIFPRETATLRYKLDHKMKDTKAAEVFLFFSVENNNVFFSLLYL